MSNGACNAVLQRIAHIVGVIDVDPACHAQPCVDEIGRIETAAELAGAQLELLLQGDFTELRDQFRAGLCAERARQMV